MLVSCAHGADPVVQRELLMRTLSTICIVAAMALTLVGCGSSDSSADSHPDKNVYSRKFQGVGAGAPGGGKAAPQGPQAGGKPGAE
jgi:hypothetical protein